MDNMHIMHTTLEYERNIITSSYERVLIEYS